jgi:hypothetical protein
MSNQEANESILALLKEAFQNDSCYEFAGNFKAFGSSKATFEKQDTLIDSNTELHHSQLAEKSKMVEKSPQNWRFSKKLKSIEISTKSSEIFKARGLLSNAQFSAEAVFDAVKGVQDHIKQIDNSMVDARVLEVIDDALEHATDQTDDQLIDQADGQASAGNSDSTAVQEDIRDSNQDTHDQQELIYLCYALGLPIFDREFVVLETRRKLKVELLERFD